MDDSLASRGYFRWDEIECPVCGKVVHTMNRGEWAYKIDNEHGRKLFCSWTCLRNYEKTIEEEIKNNPKKRKHFRGQRITT